MKTLSTILVVEDDQNLRATLVDNLEIEGYRVIEAPDIFNAEKIISKNKVDLCLLDIMLPDGNGFDFAKKCRGASSQTLILMLTAKVLDRDLELGFASGADDYLRKPFRLKELLLRVEALLRRKSKTDDQSATIVINGFKINRFAREVTLKDDHVHLTKKEFDILAHLYQYLGQVCSRNQILNAVWGEHVYIDNRSIDNFISKLKKNLHFSDDNEYNIRSVRGVGYCMYKVGD